MRLGVAQSCDVPCIFALTHGVAPTVYVAALATAAADDKPAEANSPVR